VTGDYAGILGPMQSVIAAALALVLVLAGCSVLSVDLTPRIRPLEEETVEGRGTAKILITDLSGFLSDEPVSTGLSIGTPPPRVPLLVRLREELMKAGDDPHVKALVLRVNTPGGTVTASDIMFREIDTFKRTAKVPVVAVMMDVAASGGYYVSLAADTIVAHPTTVTGSIGVIMLSFNAEGLMQKLGLGANTVKSGEHKDMGSPFRTVTSEERAMFQSVIDELQRQFVAKVADRRGIPLEAARALADGRIYTAQQALDHKLIDRIAYLPDALDMVRRTIGVEDAKIIVYKRPREYRATYYARSSSEASGVDTVVGHFAALAGAGPKFLYLWSP
jgi:protease-4